MDLIEEETLGLIEKSQYKEWNRFAALLKVVVILKTMEDQICESRGYLLSYIRTGEHC